MKDVQHVLYKFLYLIIIMRLNDVWKKANEKIGFYTVDNFEKVPRGPGVYAWFYPLRVTTKELNDFINQVNIVFNYDSYSRGKAEATANLEFTWEKIKIKAEVTTNNTKVLNHIETWNRLCESESFDEFRKIIMKSSIFLPPLYVGKTKNLYTRCYQHINGTNSVNDFHTRFEKYLEKIENATAKRISDLLFVCITTGEIVGHNNDVEGLIESIIQNLAKPKYSVI